MKVCHISFFCHEFEQNYGILRYFNQPYIETQPIKTPDGCLTGFQAKYYDPTTRISSKESDFKDAIKGAKEKYNINRIIFYINKELSVSTRKSSQKPKYQLNIENYGSDMGIKVEWRVKSNFEKMLICDDLNVVRDLYFNANPGIQDFINCLRTRSDAILNNIKSNISYQGEEIKIENGQQKINDFLFSDNNAFIVYGDAGTGKSGYIKDFILSLKDNHEESDYLLFAASDMDVEEEVMFLKQYGNYTLNDLFGFYKSEKLKICIIDAAEKYSTFKQPSVFESVIHKFIENGWKVIITIRTVYKEGFCNLFFENHKYDEVNINRINNDELEALSRRYDFILPKDDKMRTLLCNLFYLKLYLSLTKSSTNTSLNIESFINHIWNTIIRDESYQYNNFPVKREKLILDMVFYMLQSENYFYKINPSDDYETLCRLESSGVITPYDNSPDLWMLSHDVYEEIVVKHILTTRYQNNSSVEEFFEGFGNSLRSRKMFRIWLKTLLSQCDNRCIDFLIKLLNSTYLEQAWKDEVLITLMEADNKDAFHILESMLSQDEYALFTRTAFILNTACRTVDLGLLKTIPGKIKNKYRYTKPIGNAWHTFFSYINNNCQLIPLSHQNLTVVINCLKSWTTSYDSGETTRLAGIIALFLKERMWNDSKHTYHLHDSELYNNINEVILLSAIEIKAELEFIYDDIIAKNKFDHREENSVLLRKSVSNIFECGKVFKALPTKLIQLLKTYWKYQKTDRPFEHSLNMENYFGINRNLHSECYPESAFQTPIYLLLQTKPKESMDCILDIVNYATECYRKFCLESEHNECSEIEIIFSSKERKKQVCSDRLWKLYRGTSVGPTLLKSILMALEKWLLNIASQSPKEIIVSCCIYLLKNSTSAAITSVVLSVILAYPDKLFDVACVLLKTKEIFRFDISRQQSEATSNFLKGVSIANQLYDRERISSNNEAFRKKLFENIILSYQTEPGDLSQKEYDNRKNLLYNSIDEAIIDIDSWKISNKYAYYRIDLRTYKGEEIIEKSDGTTYAIIESDMPQELVTASEMHEEKRKQIFKHVELNVWAYNRFINNESVYKKYSRYEDNPIAAFEEAKQILTTKNNEYSFMKVSAVVYTYAILLRDFNNCLTDEQRSLCADVVLEMGYDIVEKNTFRQVGDGSEAIIPELARMSSYKNLKAEWDNPLFVLLAIAMNYGNEREAAIDCISKILWKNDKVAAGGLINAYIHIIPDYIEQVNKYNGIQPIEFFENNKNKIEEYLCENIETLNPEDIKNLSFDSLLVLNTMLCPDVESSYNISLVIGEKVWGQIFVDAFDHRKLSRNYELKYKYIKWLSNYMLNLSESQQGEIIKKMMPRIKYDSDFANLLTQIVLAEDLCPRYDSFWSLWLLLQNYLFNYCDSKKDIYINPSTDISTGYGFGETLVNYLLAFACWNENVKSWHTLKENNAIFYKTIANRIGYNVITLYSISRMLNSIGAEVFADEGIEWMSTIVKNNLHLRECLLPVNTLYYIEEYIYNYVRRQQCNFKSDNNKKSMTLAILDFLVDRGSTVGFFLREEIV